MKYLLLFLLIILIYGCAEPLNIQECITETPAGFWSGLIHGLIAPFTFIISCFNDSITMYEVNNIGAWYDFGFVLGSGILVGSSR